jgi:hypothetical protein
MLSICVIDGDRYGFFGVFLVSGSRQKHVTHIEWSESEGGGAAISCVSFLMITAKFRYS